MSDQQFVLRWHYHESTLIHGLPRLLEDDVLTDITLSVGSQHVRAHKVILAMCSVYFLQLFQEMRHTQHPVVVLHNVTMEDIRAVLSFIYRGQCVVSQEQLPSLLSVGRLLKIQGLCDMKVPESQAKIDPVTTLEPDQTDKITTTNLIERTDYSCRKRQRYSPKIDDGPKPHLKQSVPHWDHPCLVVSEKNSPKPEDLSCGPKKPNRETSETCKCFLCGKYLSNQYNLRVHMETHEETYHACQSCPHVSRSRDALRKHVSYRHPEEYLTRKRRKTDT
ncbi:longitudinals lacking protein, isoforms H/M/V [Aethina tumida]|uniref:longitudinals lacking protein, isoforms H/M/V n=1 Tax=Aethina tumida TaxID=116153 RepID=UPI00096B481A|nr:longitudinals lacking protein, isoforms H/M/V [Aethina tumida]